LDELKISYDILFENLKQLQDAGVMRRFASILNHRNAGFNANAMTVWDIDEKDGETIGAKAAEFSAVSHCYLRPKYPNWSYNLFTMIHGKTKKETDAIIDEIASEIEHKSKRALYSTREFKKVRLKYFTPQFLEWEREHQKGLL
jgi:DNA-binding Lrp family transcriptional regulator